MACPPTATATRKSRSATWRALPSVVPTGVFTPGSRNSKTSPAARTTPLTHVLSARGLVQSSLSVPASVVPDLVLSVTSYPALSMAATMASAVGPLAVTVRTTVPVVGCVS
jgi:hypothetical protein